MQDEKEREDEEASHATVESLKPNGQSTNKMALDGMLAQHFASMERTSRMLPQGARGLGHLSPQTAQCRPLSSCRIAPVISQALMATR